MGTQIDGYMIEDDSLTGDDVKEESLDVTKLKMHEFLPSQSVKYVYTGDVITGYELYNGNTQTSPYKILDCSLTYTGDLLTSEVYSVYENEAIKATVTYNHIYSGDELIRTEVA